MHAEQSPDTFIVSLQLHSMRELGCLDAQLAAASAAGFRHVEVLERHLQSPSELRLSLNRFELLCPSAHISMATLLQGHAPYIDSCLEAGISSVFINPMRLDDPFSPGDWSRAGEKLGRFAEDFRERGIQLGYHNGLYGFEPLNSGRCGIEDLFRSAAGTSLKWQADIGWIRRARGNPVEWLKRLKTYLVSAHVKDIGADLDVQEGWQDVGAGLLIWPILLKAAAQCGARSFVVEHDNPPDPAEFAKRSFAYLSRYKSGNAFVIAR